MKVENLLVIPHYNNFLGLCRSINSIGNCECIDVIIIDDGSIVKIDEPTVFRAKNFSGKIIFKYLSENKGIEHALNVGIEFALANNYKYISRLDCGDICIGNRFHAQQKILDNNPEIGIVGSGVQFFYENDVKFSKKFPITNEEIQRYKHINSPFSHPAVMIRTEILSLVGGYSYNYKRAEDYELFLRILRVSEGYNIDNCLVAVELNPKGISLSNRKEQILKRIKIQLEYFDFMKFSSYYGILRSLLMLVTPYKLVEFLKRNFLK